MIPGLIPMGGSIPPVAPYLTFIRYAASPSGGPAYTFSVNIGASPGSNNIRRLWALVSYSSVSGVTPGITKQTIGGVAATIHRSARVKAVTSLVTDFVLMSAQVTSGPAVTVQFSSGAKVSSVWFFTTVNFSGSPSTIATAVGTTTAALKVSCPAGGIIVALGQSGFPSGTQNVTAPKFDKLTNQWALGSDAFASGIFTTAQTNLACTLRPQPVNKANRSEAIGFSIPKI